MFYAIIYTALAINATGLGDKKFYNVDGALDPVAVTNTFEAAETGGLIGSDAAYTASLVTAPSAQSLYAGNVQLVNSFTRSVQVLTAYQHCSLISGGTVVNGEIVVPGGGTPVVVLKFSKDVDAHTINTPIKLMTASGGKFIPLFFVATYKSGTPTSGAAGVATIGTNATDYNNMLAQTDAWPYGTGVGKTEAFNTSGNYASSALANDGEDIYMVWLSSSYDAGAIMTVDLIGYYL